MRDIPHARRSADAKLKPVMAPGIIGSARSEAYVRAIHDCLG
jgi:hypothetical protein